MVIIQELFHLQVRMVSQGAQTNGYLLDSMLKELSSKFSKSIHEINVQTDLPVVERPPANLPPPPEEPEPLQPPRTIDLLDLTNEEEFHENVILGLYSHTKALEHETMSSSSGSYSVFLDGHDGMEGVGASAAALNMLVMKRILNESPSRVSLPSPSHVTILRPPEGFRDSCGSVVEVDERGGDVRGICPPPPVCMGGLIEFGGMGKHVVRKKKSSVRAKSEERAVMSDVEGGGVKKERGGVGVGGRRGELMKTDAATQSSISLHASLHDLTTIDDDDSGELVVFFGKLVVEESF